MNVSDIMKNIETNEYLVHDPEIGMIAVFDRRQNVDHDETVIKRIYRRAGEDPLEYEELNVKEMVDSLAEALVHTIDPLFLIKKVLGEMTPLDLVKTHEIVKKHPEIGRKARAVPGCLQILVENPEPGSEDIRIPIRY